LQQQTNKKVITNNKKQKNIMKNLIKNIKENAVVITLFTIGAIGVIASIYNIIMINIIF
jgi:H2-forming N5,N10-methylenetetrahydromethanopterin dehydrogenase-like enzyme